MRIRQISVAALSLVVGAVAAQAQTFNWTPVQTGLVNPGTAFMESLGGDSAIICYGNIPNPALGTTDSNGCWRTDDWGDSFTLLSDGTCTGDSLAEFDRLCTQDNVLEIAVCPENEDVIVVGAHEKGFFLTQDGGTSWTNITDGITHDDSGASQCLTHDLYDFQERLAAGVPWTGLALAFDPADMSCNSLWVGVGDIAGFDLTAGLGDHPGVFRTGDLLTGTPAWTGVNDGAYDAERTDPLACHPLLLESHTAAPTSLQITRAGTVVMNVVDSYVDADLFGTKTACSKPRIFTLTDTSDTMWVEQFHPTLEANERCQSTDGFGLSAASVTFGELTESPSGLDYLVLQMQNISTVVNATLSPTEWVAQSQGIIAGLVADPIAWLNRDAGIPAVTDAFNLAAQNVSPVTVNASGIWFVGVNDADGSPPAMGGNASFAYGGPNFGASFLNTAGLSPTMAMYTSPTQGLEESGVTAALWDGTGTKLMIQTQWYDNYDPLAAVDPGKPVEVDDGLYRSCPFMPGGNC